MQYKLNVPKGSVVISKGDDWYIGKAIVYALLTIAIAIHEHKGSK